MTSSEVTKTCIIYSFEDYSISLDKDMVNRYSKVVCPVNEDFILRYVKILNQNNNKNDAILSLEISLEMEQELSEY